MNNSDDKQNERVNRNKNSMKKEVFPPFVHMIFDLRFVRVLSFLDSPQRKKKMKKSSVELMTMRQVISIC